MNCLIEEVEPMKKCCKRENISLKGNFHEGTKKNDGLHSQCKSSRKQIQKEYQLKNRKKETYSFKTDVSFRLIV